MGTPQTSESVSVHEATKTARADVGGLGFVRILALAAFFALAAGLLETAILAFQQHVQDRIIYRSAHYLWMPAVGAFLLFALIALLLWVLSRRWRVLASLRLVSFVLCTLAIFSVISVPRAIYMSAAFLLAAGCGVALSKRIATNPSFSRNLLRWGLPSLLSVELALLLTATLLPRVIEDRVLSALGAGSRKSPNVLFIILDTVRAKSLSVYGYARKTTPHLEAIAQKGVVFERAISPAPWTLPSHASMFTGLPVHALSANRFVPLDATHATIAEALAERGYATGGFVANLAFASREFGLNRGFVHWEDYRVNLSEILANSSITRAIFLEGYSGGRNSWLLRVLGHDAWFGHLKDAASINADVVQWVTKNRSQPYFAFVNYFDAHMPYRAPSPYLGQYSQPVRTSLMERLRTERPGKWPERGDAAMEASLRDRYEESIEYLDAQLGNLLQTMEEAGLLDNTLVIIASDHGEEFGEHGEYEHDTDVFLTQVHVPLIMMQPGQIPAGRRVPDVVSLQDLPATIFELTQPENQNNPFRGQSISRFWNSTDNVATDSAAVLSILKKGRYSQASIVTPTYQYIRFADGSEDLYDHRNDEDERNDLAATETGRATIEFLRPRLSRLLNDRLREHLKLAGTPEMHPN